MAGTAESPFGTEVREKRVRSLAQQVMLAIREQIRGGAVVPGQRLPSEADIMLQHDVSRTVVREAISRLQAAGLVETRHGVGTFVLEQRQDAGFRIDPSAILTIRDLVQMLEFRICIESEAAALAAMRADEEDLQALRQILQRFEQEIGKADGTVRPDYDFHLRVASATANHYFKEIMGHLHTAIIPRTRINTAALGRIRQIEYLNNVNHEHQDIYDAIARHDPDAARAAMRLHLTSSRERLRRAHDSSPAEGASGSPKGE